MKEIDEKKMSYLSSRGLAFRGITKTVQISAEQEYYVLWNVTGVVNPGEMMALMGLSGCGKTTLLHVLSGHLPRHEYEGDILLGGKPIGKEDKQNISLVRQEDVYFPNLTVREHLAFTALLRFQKKYTTFCSASLETSNSCEWVQSVIAALLDLLSMEKCADTQIRYLSGGEKRRCSIASELLSRPQLLLLDEAASGLDSASATSLLQTLRVLAEGGSWEHSADDADSSCQRQMKHIPDPPVARPDSPSLCTTTTTTKLSPMPIVMSIHQPSPLLLNSFNKVLVLSEGCVVYYGSPYGIDSFARNLEMQCIAASELLSRSWNHHKFYVQKNSKQCPRQACPLDFIIERLASKEPWIRDKSCDDDNDGAEKWCCREHTLESSLEEKLFTVEQNSQSPSSVMSYDTAVQFIKWPRYTMIALHDAEGAEEAFTRCYPSYKRSSSSEQSIEATEYCNVVEETTSHSSPGGRLPYLAQLMILWKRAVVLTRRSSWATKSSLVETLLISLIGGLCWWNTHLTENSVVDVAGFLSFSSTYWFFSSLYVGLTEFYPERKVVQKERDAGSYQLSAFFLSKSMATLPIRILLPTIFISISYPMAFHQSYSNEAVAAFFGVLGIILLAMLAGESIGLTIGAATSSLETAMTIATTVSLSMLIFGGFYMRNVPFFLTWLTSFSAMKYSFDASVQVVIGAQRDISCDGGQMLPRCFNEDSVSSSYVLDWLNVDTNPPAMNVMYLILMAVGYRMLSYLCLRLIIHRPDRGY